MVPVDEGPSGDPLFRPHFVRFGDAGWAAWVEFTEGVAARMNALAPGDPFRGVLSKLRGYGARLAVLLWALRRCSGHNDDFDPIGVEEIAGASALVDYFERHAARAHGRGWDDRPARVARRVLAWLARNPDRTAFSRTEAFRQVKDDRDVTTSAAPAPAFSCSSTTPSCGRTSSARTPAAPAPSQRCSRSTRCGTAATSVRNPASFKNQSNCRDCGDGFRGGTGG